jgi:hypothetical protein
MCFCMDIETEKFSPIQFINLESVFTARYELHRYT